MTRETRANLIFLVVILALVTPGGVILFHRKLAPTIKPMGMPEAVSQEIAYLSPLETPPGVIRVDVETAEQMAEAVFAALPAEVAILVAAVADWRVEPASTKLKKGAGPPQLRFLPTRDILAELGKSPQRPRLLVGFAAETEQVVEQAMAKRQAKGADWIVANDVSGEVMGGHRNRVHLVTSDGVEDWPEAAKDEVARHLIARVAEALA